MLGGTAIKMRYARSATDLRAIAIDVRTETRTAEK
jgi:hypothetical protein